MATKRAKKRVRPSKSGTTETTVSPRSLPPAGTDSAAPASDSTAVSTDKDSKPYWYRTKSSKAYEQAMKILALKAAGVEEKQIAETLGIKLQSVYNYCYIAGQNGWVTDELANAKDTIEYKILPKALRRLEEGLNDTHRNEKTGMQVATTVALKIAEGTVFKKFDQEGGGTNQQTAVALTINMPPGTVTHEMRPGTVAAAPAYEEAEVVDVGNT